MYKVLVIGAAWLGDMIMSQALFKLLYSQGKTIDVIAPKWNHGILQAMPEVNQALELPFEHGEFNLIKRYQFAQTLKQYNYDECIVIPNSFKSALIAYFAGIPKRTGWLGECRFGLLNNYQKLDKKALPLMVQRLAALAYMNNASSFNQQSFGQQSLEEYYPRLNSNITTIRACFDKFNLSFEDKYIVLAPGAAFGDTKKWPEQYFAEVAVKKIQQGFKIVLLGSSKDRAVTETIEGLINISLTSFYSSQCIINMAGMLELTETVAMIARANAIVSNDSGLLHVAAALDVPLVAIYGSTSPDFTPPLIKKTKKAILTVENLECRPCFQRTCRYDHLKCLRDIKPELVNDAIENITS